MPDPDPFAELNQLLAEAMHQAQLRNRRRRKKDETHVDYAKRLAEKGLYRRLEREAHAAMDSRRFEWWFTREGADELTLDQWRAYIDLRMQRQ